MLFVVQLKLKAEQSFAMVTEPLLLQCRVNLRCMIIIIMYC